MVDILAVPVSVVSFCNLRWAQVIVPWGSLIVYSCAYGSDLEPITKRPCRYIHNTRGRDVVWLNALSRVSAL